MCKSKCQGMHRYNLQLLSRGMQGRFASFFRSYTSCCWHHCRLYAPSLHHQECPKCDEKCEHVMALLAETLRAPLVLRHREAPSFNERWFHHVQPKTKGKFLLEQEADCDRSFRFFHNECYLQKWKLLSHELLGMPCQFWSSSRSNAEQALFVLLAERHTRTLSRQDECRICNKVLARCSIFTS